MTFHQLLETLIDISDVQKTVVAQHLNISPSALSKYLTGQRVPPQYLILDFIESSARLFADNLFEHGTWTRLNDYFQFLYSFNDADELARFLREALMYYYRISDNTPRLCRHAQDNTVMVGKENILNYICIHYSDWLDHCDDLSKEEMYSTAWIHRVIGRDLAARVTMNRKEKDTVAMHHFVHNERLKKYDSLIVFAREVEQYWSLFDLSFWTASEPPHEHFLFVRGHSLVIFDFLPYDEPIMLLITDKDYISRIEPHLMKYFQVPLMKNRAGFEEAIAERGQELRDYLTHSLRFTFSFFPMSLLLTREDLLAQIPDRQAAELLADLYETIAGKPKNMIVSLDSLKRLMKERHIAIPFYKAISLNPQDTLKYLNRYTDSLYGRKLEHLSLYKERLDYTLVLCMEEEVIFFFLGNERNEDKYVIFPVGRENIDRMLANDTAQNKSINIALDHENWSTFTTTLDILLRD